MEIKKNIPNNTITRKLVDLDKETGNIYETVNIIARRANQISTELKTELEISRYYERLPKPAIIATEEFLDGELFYKENKEAKES